MRERLSKQICRVVAIMQTLHRDGQLTLTQIHARLESRYCRRTIRRDVAALVALGCVRQSESRWKSCRSQMQLREYHFELTLGNVAQLPDSLSVTKPQKTKPRNPNAC